MPVTRIAPSAGDLGAARGGAGSDDVATIRLAERFLAAGRLDAEAFGLLWSDSFVFCAPARGRALRAAGFFRGFFVFGSLASLFFERLRDAGLLEPAASSVSVEASVGPVAAGAREERRADGERRALGLAESEPDEPDFSPSSPTVLPLPPCRGESTPLRPTLPSRLLRRAAAAHRPVPRRSHPRRW